MRIYSHEYVSKEDVNVSEVYIYIEYTSFNQAIDGNYIMLYKNLLRFFLLIYVKKKPYAMEK